MTLVTAKEVLTKANRGNYAVGHFNTNNMETTRAIIAGAEAQNSPVIIGISPTALAYAGFEAFSAYNKVAAEMAEVPVVVNLDHCTEFKMIKHAIDCGFTSVMIDASHFPFENNVRITKQVVQYAHSHGVSVEGELGTIGGAEDAVSEREIILTDPQAAVKFVKETGIDSLAIAIGTSHGAYKFARPNQKIDIKRLKEIKDVVDVPLVLHGASSVPGDVVHLFQSFGGLVIGAVGLAEPELRRAVKAGINKVNTDTDLRFAYTAALRETLIKNPREISPRGLLTPSIRLMQKKVEERISLLGSKGKA